MKYNKIFTLAAVFSILLIAGCRKTEKSQLTWLDTEKVVFNDIYNNIELAYPYASGGQKGVSDSINNEILRLLKSGLCINLTDENLTLAEAVDSMLAEKRRDEQLQKMKYEFLSSGSLYILDGITSLELNIYGFCGGAHGNTTTFLRNFDNKTGRQLSVTELFTDTVELSRLNRAAFLNFLASTKLTSEDIESYLFVAPGELPLPENIGFDSVGAVMLYNQYEIAAYAFGQSRYVLPFSDLQDILTVLKIEENR